MKYLSLALIAFSSSLCMQLPQQNLQKKLAAARLHNRTQCPLAKLPKDIQDYISEYLEFNDRETDEEFVKNALPDLQNKRDGSHTLGFPIHGLSDEMRTKYAGRKTPSIIVDEKPCIYDLSLCASPDAEKAFIEILKPHESPEMFTSLFPSVDIMYSRDRSKVIMQRSLGNNQIYFFIYDMQEKKTVYAHLHTTDPSIFFYKLLAVSNDGKIFSIRHVNHPPHADLYGIVREDMYYHCGTTEVNLNVEFNKQSTRLYVKQKHTIHTLCSEQEHKERSKKTLAVYFHQKGICKPFNYRQETT